MDVFVIMRGFGAGNWAGGGCPGGLRLRRTLRGGDEQQPAHGHRLGQVLGKVRDPGVRAVGVRRRRGAGGAAGGAGGGRRVLGRGGAG